MTTLSEFLRDQSGYRRVFVMEFGGWPHACYFCGDEVDGHTAPFDSTAAVVHHVDENRSNNVPENLVPAHHGCHARYHMAGNAHSLDRSLSPEHRAAISAAHAGKVTPPDVRAKMSAAKIGKKPSLETRAKLSAAQKRRFEREPMRPMSPETRAKLIAAQRALPYASCVKCHRKFRVGTWLANHLRACLKS